MRLPFDHVLGVPDGRGTFRDDRSVFEVQLLAC